MISGAIRQLCVLSIFFGAAVSVAPQGGVKRVMELVCTAALILTVAMPLKGMDLEAYALEIAKYKEKEIQLSTEGQELSQRLNRLVIEDEYGTYIVDKAGELGIDRLTADVEAQWSMEGLWIPYSVTIEGEYTPQQKNRLSRLLIAQLGIPADRQYWSAYE